MILFIRKSVFVKYFFFIILLDSARARQKSDSQRMQPHLSSSFSCSSSSHRIECTGRKRLLATTAEEEKATPGDLQEKEAGSVGGRIREQASDRRHSLALANSRRITRSVLLCAIPPSDRKMTRKRPGRGGAKVTVALQPPSESLCSTTPRTGTAPSATPSLSIS